MKRAYRIALDLMILCAILIVMGCPKKQLEPTAPEILKPQAQHEVGPSTEQPVMKMETSGSAQAAGTAQGKSALDQARAALENKDILFEYDSFELTSEARKTLAGKAGFMNSHPRLKVRIEGHCDERGTQEYNLALGERRAKAAQDYLVFLGISAERVSTVSYGEERPVDQGHNETAWAKNRRAHFALLSE